jgi:hypothetical protein
VQDHYIYDYAVIRVVPKVEREEFINVGVILSCPEKEYLEARIELDEQKLKTLDPEFDIETAKTHLAAFQIICEGGSKAGEIGRLKQKERFNWLTSPRSTIIQTSPVHTGYCKNPAEVLEHLVDAMVRKNK